jgi:O-antigen ligase
MSRKPSASLKATPPLPPSEEAKFPYFLLLLFVASLAVMKNPNLPLVHRKLQVSDFLFLALAASAIFHYRRTLWRPVPPGLGIVLAFPLGLAPSFLATQSLGRSAIQYAGIWYVVALYGVFLFLLKSDTQWWGVVRVWFWTTLVVVALSWMGWLLSNAFGLANPFLSDHTRLYGETHPLLTKRLLGTFHHPAMLAAYLNASLASILLYSRLRRWSTFVIGTLLAVVVLTAIMTKARASAGVMLSAALLWTWSVPGTSRTSRRLLGGLAVGMAALAIMTSFWWIVPLRPASGFGGLPLAPNRNHTPYYYFHSAALQVGLDHPWTGVGLEQYNSHMVDYIDWEEARSGFLWTDPELKMQYGKPMDPHSTYLGYWAEAGLPGMVGLGILLGGLLWTFWRGKRLYSSSISSIFLAVLVGFLLNAYYLDITTLRFFWAAMALGTTALSLNLATE